MLLFIIAIAVLAVDQFSKYWIMGAHVAGTLGYTGAWNDLSALRAFLADPAVAVKNAIPQDGSFIVLSFTPNDAALWGIGNGNPWAAQKASGPFQSDRGSSDRRIDRQSLRPDCVRIRARYDLHEVH